MKFCKLIVFFLLSISSIRADESISSQDNSYRDVCQKAAVNPFYFQNFRSMPAYRKVVELTEADAFYRYLSFTLQKWDKKLEVFRKLDTIGNPMCKDYPGLGAFSGTTLRYMVIADQIMKMFSLPEGATIAEIGAGFGGQSYILSQLCPFARYYVYDLPEVEALITKVMKSLQVDHVECVPFDNEIPSETIDLVISNYAYSECDRALQLAYFEKVIKKANRGYVLYNQISRDDFHMDSLTPKEFIQLLKNSGAMPKIFNEFLPTGGKNVLIIWDKTKVALKK